MRAGSGGRGERLSTRRYRKQQGFQSRFRGSLQMTWTLCYKYSGSCGATGSARVWAQLISSSAPANYNVPAGLPHTLQEAGQAHQRWRIQFLH